jgi:hypothetical protein
MHPTIPQFWNVLLAGELRRGPSTDRQSPGDGSLRVLATRYRRRAQECLDIARASVGEKRIILLDIAQTWLRLAEEEDASIPSSAAEQSQPIVQQQQQIHRDANEEKE